MLPLFVLDPALFSPAGLPRRAFLARALGALDRDLRLLGSRLVVRSGSPETVVPQVVAECRAQSVHITADHGPYGRMRDESVATALGEVPLIRSGSAYAVSPGRIRNKSGDPFRVYGAFYRAWCDHGWPAPATNDPGAIEWIDSQSEPLPPEPDLPEHMVLPQAGEAAARSVWCSFRDSGLSGYSESRDRPDLDATSRLSVHLKFGSLHPRTLLADLGPDDDRFRRELAWREFYGAVLAAWPASARENFDARFEKMRWVSGPYTDSLFEAWTEGRTGFPLVDAGMRQLSSSAFMHNRVRMAAASFLVKDLHIDWRRGARHFMRLLVDGDLASNQHGWQWTAGTGTDASPYHRVFNPVTQARRFDPDGIYVRRWVPELADLDVPEIFEPWKAKAGPPKGYPEPIVDHAAERIAALDLFAEAQK